MSPSVHTAVDRLRQELHAMADVGMITNIELAKATSYVVANQDEIAEMLDSPSSISEIADCVLDMVRACGVGKCE